MKSVLLSRSLLVLSIAAAVAGCSDDSDGPPGAAGSSGSGGRAGSGGAAGAAGSAGQAGASGAAGVAGSGGAGNDAGTDAFDYDGLCTSYCNAAAAFRSGAGAGDAGSGDAGISNDAGDTDAGTSDGGAACEADIPDCLAGCVGTGEAFHDTACGDEVRAMYQCFISDDAWSCGGSPSFPNPAGCAEQQTEFAICSSQI